MIIGHFGILLEILFFWTRGGFLFEEMTTAFALIAPLFAGYTTVILSFIIEHSQTIDSKSNKLSYAFVFASFMVPLLFICVVGGAVALWANRIGFTEFDQFKTLVGVLEAAFGIYVGQFIYSMFKKPETIHLNNNNNLVKGE